MPGLFLVGTRLTADVLNSATYRPYCKMHQTVAQTGIADGADVVLTFTTEDHDPDGWHDNSVNTTRVTPNIAGEYRVTVLGVSNAQTSTTSITSIFAQVNLNGSAYSRGGNVKPTDTDVLSGFGSIHVDTVTLNGTTDYVEAALQAQVETNATWATNVSGSGRSMLLVEYMGPS